MAQIALAWVMAKPGTFLLTPGYKSTWFDEHDLQGVTAPIIGTTSLENLKDNLGMLISTLVRVPPTENTPLHIGALDVKLSEEDIKYLEEPYTPVPVRGHF